MKMLKIKAGSMRDALAEARRALGGDAVVLHTKQYEIPSMLGLCRKQGVEILATSSRADQPTLTPPAPETAPEAVRLQVLERHVGELRRALSDLATGSVVARRKERSERVERLMKNGVSEHVAEMALSGCAGGAEVLQAISRRIRCTGSIDCSKMQQRVALVGPTGVGKTTTVAKLAAQYSIFCKKSVALVTLDTYRIGAVEQLATYSKILGLPFEVALSPEDGEGLIAKHDDKDLIIIDTVGRSQRKREHIEELASFLRGVQPTEVHLALSASSDSVALREAVESFRSLKADRIILTKLDECARPGCALELAASSLMPYSYVTTGQDVPDDIAVAESSWLAKLVWEGAL
jgi:flagellar biosynthesis protein FlhF